MFKHLLSMLVAFTATASAWAFTSVTSLPKGQETKTTYVITTPRGTLYCNGAVNDGYLLTTIKHSATASVSDAKFQFLLFQSTNETTGYYLYNVSLGKFLGRQSGNDVTMTDTPSLWYIFKTGQTGTNQSNQINSTPFNCADFPWCVSTLDGEFNGGAIAVSNWDCTYGTRVSGNSWDGGNQFCIAQAESADEAVWKTAYDKVVTYEANLGTGETAGNGLAGELDPTKVLDNDTRTKQEQAALDIINRFTEGTMNVDVILDLCRTTKGCDQYKYSADSETLTIHASSAVAACRGFYDYVKAKGAGFICWSGKRFVKPSNMACDEVSLITQFRDHQYFNVVTYGYTTPYWGKDRWRQELDWMALHGVDMPLMLVGSEAIYRKVFMEDYGLTKEDVDAWEVGPAHLPWFRMGNLSGNSFDGPLGDEWNNNQRELAHYLLEEMDKLGMKPVCPAFGGFVPQAFSKTGTTPATVGWNWCKPGDRNVPNYRLSPDDPKFMEVGKKFMQRWEDEYGACKYYLSDSFNEMDVPSNTSTLTQYGDNIYSIIQSSRNKESVWVTQGWTFCYQLGSWGKAKFDALTRNVPADRFDVLYMSPEYAELYGHARDYDNNYQGFNGKGWNCTMLPNMGGKNFWTGNLNKYAKGYLNDLYNASNPGNITGYGMTPEGVENNEMLYELITDAGWTRPGKTINLDDWMDQYATSRFGENTAEMAAFHTALRNTLYNTYKDHPRFAWQNQASTGTGIGQSVSATYLNAVETLFSNTAALKAINSDLLESELIEAVSMYVGAKIENLCQNIKNNRSNPAECNRLIAALEDLMLDFDAALELHPIWNLKRWEDMAQACGNQDAVRNAKNARRIVTVWFGNHTKDEPVQDYAARIWGGLMRDFYCPRLINQLKSECGLSSGWNRIQFENNFVNAAPYLSAARPVEGDHIDFLVRLINKAKNFGNVEPEPVDNFIASTNNASYWYIIRNNANDKVLTTAGDAKALTLADDTKEAEQIWRIVRTGDDTYRLESRFGQNIAVIDGVAKTYLPAINCDIRISKVNTTAGATTFSFSPVSGDAQLLAGEWTLEELTPSLIPEAASIDYTHYMRQLVGFTQSELFDKSGQPLSEDALTAGIKELQKEASNIDHKTFATFLQQWDVVLGSTIKSSDNADVARLIALVMSAHQIVVPADASDAKAATLLDAIKAAETVAANGGNATEAHTTLTAAILAYYAAGGIVTETDLDLGFANFPYVSDAPKNGRFAESSTVITLKCLNGGYLSTTARDTSGNFQYAGDTKPTTAAGYWVVCGDDAKGYTFYNVEAGAGKVLGFTGSEGTARAQLYDAKSVPDGVTTSFKYAVNNNGYAVFLIDGTNAWNNHANGGYLALWNNAATLTDDRGSSYVIEEVENYEFETPALRTATITAVFPDGSKHVVYSNGSILTANAADQVPQGAISNFTVESYDEESGAIVLKAGDKYLHMACGTDGGGIEKMSDSDGLSEEPNDWTTLTLERPTTDNLSLGKHANHGTGDWDAPSAELYQIKGMCSDGSTHYFILRSADHGWAGAAPSQKFFDSNWDGNGYRTSFFEVTITEPQPEISVEDLIPSIAGYKVLTPISDTSELVSGKYFVSVYSKGKEGLLYGNEFKNVSSEIAAIDKTLGEAYVWTVNVNDDGTFTLTNSQGKTLSVQGANGVGKHNVKYTDEGGSYAAANFSFNTTVVPINGVNHWMLYQQNMMVGATNATDDQKKAYLHCNCDNPGLTDSHLRLSYWEGYNATLANNVSCDKIAFYPAKAVYDGEATIGTLVIIIDNAQQGNATLEDINLVRDVILEK